MYPKQRKPAVKMTPELAASVWDLYRLHPEYTQKYIAALYGLHRHTVSYLVKRHLRWR